MKKLLAGATCAVIAATAMTGTAFARDLSGNEVVNALFGDDASSKVLSLEQDLKKTLKSVGFDLPVADDAAIWGLLKEEGYASYEDLEIAKDQSVFPEKVYYRDNNESFNSVYDYYLYEGSLYLRHRNSDDAWRAAPMTEELKGNVKCMSADTHGIYLVDEKNYVYTCFECLSDTSAWYWKTAVIGLMETQPFYQLRTSEQGQWALSVVDASYNVNYTDADGNQFTTGGSGCTNLYYINPEDNTEIIYGDPWLPGDESRAIASPVHGTFQVQTFSASCSELFVTNAYGDLYTRCYDFDLSGGDELFFDYTWNSNTEFTTLTEQFELVNQSTLPSEQWCQQPKIDGIITDRLTVVSNGEDASNYTLIVEGMKDGKTGYFYKQLYDGVNKQSAALGEAGTPAKNGSSAWKFQETGEPLQGNILKNSLKDTSTKDLTAETGYNFSGKLYNATMTVENFNYAASDQEATITVGDVTVPAKLFCEYGNLGTATSMVITRHSAGFTEDPRLYNAAIYLPDDSYDALMETEAGQEFLSEYMEDCNIRAIALVANTDTLAITDNGKLQGVVLVGTYNLDRVK